MRRWGGRELAQSITRGGRGGGGGGASRPGADYGRTVSRGDRGVAPVDQGQTMGEQSVEEIEVWRHSTDKSEDE